MNIQAIVVACCRSSALALVIAACSFAAPAWAQKAFPTPDAAAEAFVDNLARHDGPGLESVLGRDYRKIASYQGINAEDVTDFLAGWAAGHRVVTLDPDTAAIELSNGWRMPVPMVKTAAGWVFDTKRGADEMRTRRIGRDELVAIRASYAYVEAQKEYASADRNGDGRLEYAQKIISSPGKRDGLFWPNAQGEAESPLGPLLDTQDFEDGYHGYRFRILKAQGPAARGGARNYVQHGQMRYGFALVAWPAHYGDSGVMTFMVNHDGVVYQKDLGPNSAAIARAMTRFDPDSSWQALPTPK